MTIRRALQELVNEGVLVRHRGRGKGTFVCNALAKSFSISACEGRLRKIGIVHAYEWETLRETPVFFLTFLEIQAECSRMGVSLEFLPLAGPSGASSPTPAKLARESGCQALVVLDWPRPEELLEAQAVGIPVVVAGPFQETLELSFVSPNDFQGAYAATKYLLDLGFCEVAMVSSRKGDARVTHDREAGWRFALGRLPGEGEEAMYRAGRRSGEPGQSFDEIVRDLAAEFARRPPPPAIFARDGMFARAAIRALSLNGKSCPGDVSVTCVGSFFEGGADQVRMTAARVEDGALGRETVRLAAEHVSGRRASPVGILLPMRVVEGGTTFRPGTEERT
jgi:DNA-binding LacI/PurR family transcriptional regulator